MKKKGLRRKMSCRKGMTLLEVLACVAIFGFVVAMAGPLMFDFRTANARLARSMEHVTEMDRLNRIFRADMAKAKEIVPQHGSFELSPQVLILRSLSTDPQGLPIESERDHVIYSYNSDRSELVRVSYSLRHEGRRRTSRVVARGLQKAEFLYGPEDALEKSVVELQLTFKKGIAHKIKPTSYNLFASVGE